MYEQYKNEVEEALVSHFGSAAVKRGNKAIDIHETSYHVEADVAPFFEYRKYSDIRLDPEYGVSLVTDSDKSLVINWPVQHYKNGVTKNNETGRRYKSIVRVLKALANEMAEKGYSADNIPGFLIECLVWNVPNSYFQTGTYTDIVKAVIAKIYGSTETDNACQNLTEISKLKPLFSQSQKWTRIQANAFSVCAWGYVGYGS